MTRLLRLFIASCTLALAVTPAMAQISFTTAIDLALKNSPRVLMAKAEVDKAQAVLEQTNDVYVPTLAGGSGLGWSYGFPLGQPSVFNFTSQSLLLSFSQKDYIRAARASLNAANLALRDVRQAVAEETAITYLALDYDQQRQAVLGEQGGFAAKLVGIVQARLDAGQDSPIDLTTAKLSAAQIRLARLRVEGELTSDQAHLARLTGLPAQGLNVIPSSIPQITTPTGDTADAAPLTSPAVESAYAIAKAKQETAFGDSRYLWRPQIYFVAQYSLFAKFNNYDQFYQHFQYNNAGIGVDIKFPIFDYVNRAKSRESAAEAVRARREADVARDQFYDGRLKLQNATTELAARAEVASLDQQLAQQQLAVLEVQLKAGTGNPSGPPMTPKDEQLSRISEREKFLAVLNASFQMRQSQISLMRQTGDLEPWLKAAAAQAQPPDTPKP